MEADAEGQIESREHQQSPESLQQQGHQADLEHVGVEHHQQNDDHVEQDGNVLDAVDTDFTGLLVILVSNGVRSLCLKLLINAAVECKENTCEHVREKDTNKFFQQKVTKKINIVPV